MRYAIYFSLAIIFITAISYNLVSLTITKVRNVATNNAQRLRGTTPQEALEKVAKWESSRAKLWPLTRTLVVLSLICGAFAQILFFN